MAPSHASRPTRWWSRSAASATRCSAAAVRRPRLAADSALCCPGAVTAARAGERLKLLAHPLVREDAEALYGFRSVEELGFFELLITVTGVGPKVGLAIVSSRPVPDLQLAILQGDEAVLTAVSGVGKRLAGRIVLELKEKVASAGAAAGAT